MKRQYMRNKELVIEVLRQIQAAAQKVVHRFQVMNKPTDFTDSPAGIEKMDAICMMLIDCYRRIVKKSGQNYRSTIFLAQYPDVDWKKAKGMWGVNL